MCSDVQEDRDLQSNVLPARQETPQRVVSAVFTGLPNIFPASAQLALEYLRQGREPKNLDLAHTALLQSTEGEGRGVVTGSFSAARQKGVKTLKPVPEPVSTEPGSCSSVPGYRFTSTPSSLNVSLIAFSIAADHG